MMRRRAIIGAALAAPALIRRAQAQLVFPAHRFPGFVSPLRAPSGPVTVDWSHPLANGLIACYVPAANGLFDITGQTLPLVLNAGGSIAGDGGPFGMAIQGDSATTPPGAQTAAQPVNLCISTALTIGAAGQNTGVHTTTQFPIVGLTKPAGSSYLATINTHANSGPLVIVSGNGGSPIVNTSTVSPTQPGPIVCAASFVFPGGTGECAANGVSGGTYTTTGTPTYDSTARFGVGSNTFAVTEVANYNTAGACVWNRALSHDELLLYTREPFSMLRPALLEARALLGGTARSLGLLGVGQ